jgi:hypothetical protein
MGKQADFEAPAGLQELAKQFEEWRSSHAGRKPIPESLWMGAAEAARQHGVFRTAKILRLDYTKLKQQMEPAPPPTKPVSAVPPPAFVEFLQPPATPPTCECVIEVEGPRGRMRVEWKGTTTPDLCALSRTLWEPGT